jgi:hypothetical protein
MFTNTLNSLDFSLFLKFLTKYCAPDFAYYQTYTGTNKDNVDHHPRLIQIHSVLATAQYWFNKLESIPDVVYQLLNTKLHTYSNTKCSKVVSVISASATRMYDLQHTAFVHLGNSSTQITNFVSKTTESNNNKRGRKRKPHISLEKHQQSSDILILGAKSAEHINKNITMSNIDRTCVASYLKSVSQLASPTQRLVTIKLTLNLDANKCIQKMEFQMTPREETMTEIVYN